MPVLYRKYRPQTFFEVVGQAHIIRTLKNQVGSHSVAHAYLFTGGRGVGKTSVARILAKAVNCEKRLISKATKDSTIVKTMADKKGSTIKDIAVSDACGVCSVCKQIEAGTFIDLVEIDAASNTGVDNIRDLIEHVKFTPAIGTYKVFIIDEVHMLSKGAFNALLKTLEEPPAHVIFILATTEIQKVPPTIISRTQRFDFKSLPVEDLINHMKAVLDLEKIEASQGVLELVAAAAQGSARDCLSLLDKVLGLGSNPDLSDARQLLGVTDIALSEELFAYIAEQNAAAIPGFFERLSERGTDMSVLNKDFLEYLRSALVLKAAGQIPAFSHRHVERVTEIVSTLSLGDILLIARLFLKSYKDLSGAISSDIPLLLAALESCNRKNVQLGAVVAPAHHSPVAHFGSNEVPKALLSEAAVPAWGFTQVFEPSPVLPTVLLEQEAPTRVIDLTVLTSEIQPHWPAIIHAVKIANGPVGNVLKNATFEGVADGRAWVGVDFLFHKQNLENQKSMKIICDIMEQISGKRLGFGAKIVKRETKVQESAEALGDALKIFGGEVVE